MKTTQVDDIEYGVYLWRDGQGRYVADSDRNYMLIASRKGDQTKIDALRQAARSYGIMDGEPEFRSGSRPISDAEYEEQKARQSAGYVPDPYDLGNLIDEYKYNKGVDNS